MPDDPQIDSLNLLPPSLEAEQSVLGGLLLDNDAADRVGDVAAADDFYTDAHRVIYRHVMQLIANGKPADVVTLAESLSSAQKLDYVGGLAYLGALVQNVPTAANIRHYAQILRDRSILRPLALNIGENVALDTGMPIAVFSMEMGAAQLALRMIGSVGRLDQHKLRTGRLVAEDWDKLSAALGRLNEAPILIDETPALNAIEVRSRARRLMRQYGQLGLVIVDYLQLMQASTQGENRATELSEISRAMKSLAKELQVPVVALSQLNRSLEQRPDK